MNRRNLMLAGFVLASTRAAAQHATHPRDDMPAFWATLKAAEDPAEALAAVERRWGPLPFRFKDAGGEVRIYEIRTATADAVMHDAWVYVRYEIAEPLYLAGVKHMPVRLGSGR